MLDECTRESRSTFQQGLKSLFVWKLAFSGKTQHWEEWGEDEGYNIHLKTVKPVGLEKNNGSSVKG